MGKAATAIISPVTALTGAGIGALKDAIVPKIPDIQAPTPSTPAQAPAFGDPAQQEAQKKTLAALQRRQGRAASVLTAGGLDNSSSKLGG